MAMEAVSSTFEVWAGQNENPDYRRAATAAIARAAGRLDQFNEVVAQAVQEGRMGELITTAAQVFMTLMPEMHLPAGRQSLAQLATALSGEE
jgi:hypothetical protein